MMNKYNLFNYIQDDRKASEYTLNTIAIYLGFDNWETYLKAKNIDSEWKTILNYQFDKRIIITHIT